MFCFCLFVVFSCFYLFVVVGCCFCVCGCFVVVVVVVSSKNKKVFTLNFLSVVKAIYFHKLRGPV